MLSIETAAGSIAEAMFDLTPHMAPPAKEAKVAKEAIAEGAE